MIGPTNARAAAETVNGHAVTGTVIAADPPRDGGQANPEQAVDAIEQRVLGHPTSTADDDEPDTTPAFEHDLDSQDQGSAEAADEQPG